MADFDLAAMARAAGIRVNKLLAQIEATNGKEEDLYRIILPIVRAYLDSVDYLEGRWSASQLSQAVVEGILATVSGYGLRAVLQAEPLVGQWAQEVEAWHRRRWTGVVKGATRLDIGPILQAGDVRKIVEARTQQNVALIRGLSDEVYKRIERIVWNAYADGTTPQQLARTLRDDIGFAKKRARLIARDQLGKYSGALDKARQEQAGIDSYVWKSVGDDRVRPKHRENNGKRFSWSKRPAQTGHPGEDIQCRCKAKAVLLTVDEEAEVQRIIATL